MADIAAGNAAFRILLSSCHIAYSLLLSLSAPTALSEREKRKPSDSPGVLPVRRLLTVSLVFLNSPNLHVVSKVSFCTLGKAGFLEARGLRNQQAPWCFILFFTTPELLKTYGRGWLGEWGKRWSSVIWPQNLHFYLFCTLYSIPFPLAVISWHLKASDLCEVINPQWSN